ncbi:MAG: amidohydrolase family protein [Elusimicrobia bacterium]|nr:amidohydrolase family protein [Elusimicrobiota bacterium]
MDFVVRGAGILGPEGAPAAGDLLVRGGRVAAIGGGLRVPKGVAEVSGRGAFLLPGLVDLQINGAWGADFLSAPPSAILRCAERLAADGVTAFLPTLITAPLKDLEAAMARLCEAAAAGRGARILGFHLEGPFLAGARRGAHRAACLRPPSVADFQRLWRASRGRLRLLTLAPELRGAGAVIAAARRRGVVVSLGHTDGSAADMERAAARGARLVTHLFNAMPQLHHRVEGAAGAALTDDRLACGLIYDRNHVGRRAAALALRAKGPRGLFLVSDAVFALGLRPGRYRSSGTDSELKAGALRVRGGPLGGAVRSLRQCAVMFAKDLRLPLWDAWRLASELPSALIAHRGGVLAPGGPADMALVAPDGRVRAAWVGGQRWK